MSLITIIWITTQVKHKQQNKKMSIWDYIKLKTCTAKLIKKLKRKPKEGENICKPHITYWVNIKIYKHSYN